MDSCIPKEEGSQPSIPVEEVLAIAYKNKKTVAGLREESIKK
jgi:hypothetical protein